MVLLFKDTDIAPFSEMIGKINITILVFACSLALIFRLALYPHMWHGVLASMGIKIKFFDLFTLNLSALPLKFVLPFKIADFARVGGLFVFTKVEFPVAASSMVFMKVSSIAGLMLLITLGNIFTGKFNYIYFFIITMLVYGLIFSFHKNIKSALAKTGLSQASLEQWFMCFDKIAVSDKLKLSLYAVVLLLGEIAVSFLIFMSLGSKIGFISVLFYMPFIMFLTTLPISMHGIGVRETLIVATLSLYGTKELLLLSGVLISGVYFVMPTVIALVFLLFYSGGKFFLKSFLYKEQISVERRA